MKAIFNTLLVALTLTVTTFSASQAASRKPIGRPQHVAAFQSSLYTTAEGKLQIAVRKEVGNTVKVRLINAEGKEVFAERIGKRQDAVRLRLDVSNLSDGIYQVEVTNGVETTTQKVTLATQQPAVPQRLVAVN